MTQLVAPRPPGGVLACPACGEALPQAERVFRCVNGHSFDVAKEGYVNLLLAQHRRSKDPGYSKEMIASRRAFLDAGHYQRLADSVAELIILYLPGEAGQVVLDAGCGEGYYLRRLLAVMAEHPHQTPTLRCGLDISKHGIRVAAKRDAGGVYAVASTFRMPVLAGAVDVLLTHFSPVSGPDFRRVVRPGGVVLVGGPGEGHLFAFKQLLYDEPTPHEPEASLASEPGFELIDTRQIRHRIELRGPGQVANLLLMTPYYWSAGPQTRDRLARLEGLDTEVDVVVHAYRRTREAA